ncbi:hypothetical protein ABZ299_06415 [Streptomyces sp. NPDC006184]|uniref:esterase/lipase family protein n=1 Tax=Streptomyces sp. NPDC006184 TaxID=3155455 RepID=UPI0033AEB798
MSTPVVSIFTPLSPPEAAPRALAAAPYDTHWPLDGGTAWVFYSSPDQTHVRRPVILADGFSLGASNVDALYEGLENGAFPFVSALREQGYDLVLLGFDERSASITDNAAVAIECIKKAIDDREGSAQLTVGGFSMGGLVTRYALAKLGSEGFRHETATYLSYDTPHRGAWLPVGVQAFAHFVKKHWGGMPLVGELLGRFSTMVNSPAARQLLRWHVETAEATADQDRARTDFLDELERVGSWPAGVRLLGVANGAGNGIGNAIPKGVPAMSSTGPVLNGTQLFTQDIGNPVVANLHGANKESVVVRTDGLPDIDGAPGGLFPVTPGLPGNPANFGTAAMLAEVLDRKPAELVYNASVFVPTVSAVAAGDIDDRHMLYGKIDPEASELDDFLCAGENEGHTVMTEELGRWILERITAG